ncbi:hypothetical protein SEA_ZOOMAN_340 [Microbacterium phage Zooman]|nr:hypothetical protein SEA_ZOOMAN_27 [Microbacterium phage Zooman]UDL16581.1 hypothetical protein SEA_ZOOMAN_340 [Microbacterium phage Zooman]
MRDFWVDGHHISAKDESAAREEARRLYEYEPEQVLRWEDSEDADEEDDDYDPSEEQAAYDDQWGDPLEMPSYAS